MARHPTTPQEKKRLSYERDRREAYGNNDKAARTAVPRHKRARSRNARHHVQQVLPGAGSPDAVIEQMERAEVRMARSPGDHWQKVPGRTLAEAVERQRARRAEDERRAARPRAPRPQAPVWLYWHHGRVFGEDRRPGSIALCLMPDDVLTALGEPSAPPSPQRDTPAVRPAPARWPPRAASAD